MLEFLNKEVTPTWGSQISLVLITIFLTLVITEIWNNPLKNIVRSIRKKMGRLLKKPSVKQRLDYLRIIIKEKKSARKDSRPNHFPPGLSLGDWHKYQKRLSNGHSLEYKKLEDKIKHYKDTYHARMEAYYERNPEERKKDEEAKARAEAAVRNMQQTISNSFSHMDTSHLHNFRRE